MSAGISSIAAGSWPRESTWKLSRHTPTFGWSASCDDAPRPAVVVDEPAPGQRLERHLDVVSRGEVAESAQLIGRHLVGVDGRGRHVAADQDDADAEALRGGEGGACAAQVVGEGVLVDALDVAQRLIEVQRQAEPAAQRADLLRAVVVGDQVGFEQLDAVEARRRAGVQLLGERTAQRHRGDGRLHRPTSRSLMYEMVSYSQQEGSSKLRVVTAEPRPEPLRDAERTRADLIEVATAVFAEQGYSGARVDEIAERTRTTKRMIYYYFGGKEQLYLAVLENAYRGIREAEQQLQVDHVDPVEAIRAVAEMTFDHHIAHQDFIRLVAIENIHRGEFIGRLDSLRSLGQPATSLLDQILTLGREQGVFRADVDALDVHILISSYCVFQVANRYTFGYLFDIDFTEHDDPRPPAADARRRRRRLAHLAADLREAGTPTPTAQP